MKSLPDGLVAVVKKDCPTCVLVESVLGTLAQTDTPLTVYSQDNATFPTTVSQVIDDTTLEQSYQLNIETVPTLIKVEQGQEQARIIGWNKTEWQTFNASEQFSVPADSKFQVKVAQETAYLCQYG